MRVGENPAMAGRLTRSTGTIRVVVPVHLPELEGYWRDGLEILDLCLDSLVATGGDGVRLTVVANGCADDVLARLGDRFQAGELDELIVHQANLGKVDGFLSGARASWEPLVVVSDADVLWQPGWVPAVLCMMAAFPECGVLSAAPAPNLAGYATSATVLGALLGGELGRRSLVDGEDLQRFSASVGTADLFAGHERAQWCVSREGVSALVGGGHFACAFRRSVLEVVPTAPCDDIETRWLDLPPDAAGWWRLATPRAYAWHLGNVLEPWMAAAPPVRADTGPDVDLDPPVVVGEGRPSRLGSLPLRLRQRAASVVLRSSRRWFERGGR